MDDLCAYRITNYLNEGFPDAFVASAGPREDVARLSAYLFARMREWSDENMALDNGDIAGLLVRFFGFSAAPETADAKEIDVEMELKCYEIMGRWQPGYYALLDDPALAVEGLDDEFVRITREAHAD